ncbi:hypothetical protein [Pseudomonas syringae]|uniref:hypothetical protein n=1 Tax=Pseudomonas syringae TaxID=317 RepID=UPI000A620020|nr:hypothetical protein [Pseudomonas syringae]
MYVIKYQHVFIRWLWVPLLPVTAFYLWNFTLPGVTVHYPKQAREEFNYIWNVQHRIYKGEMKPGGGAFDTGFLFPDDDFFMMFDWWSTKGNGQHCVSIKPKWPSTDIYLNVDGSVDVSEGSGTDVDRLSSCPEN